MSLTAAETTATARRLGCTRRHLIPVAALGLVVLAACAGSLPRRAASIGGASAQVGPPSPLPVFPWQPSGPIAASSTSGCRHILLVGDSVMVQTAARLQPLYQRYSYCARIDDEAFIGSAPAYMVGYTSWTARLRTLLSRSHYDAVVAFFQGNGSTANPSNADALLASNEAGTLRMIDAAAAADVPMYWSYPMLSAYGCKTWSSSFTTNGYEAYRQWVFTQLPALRPGVVRVNENVLTPTASPTQRGPATFNDSLSFGNGVQKVRASDCIHLNGAGASVAAYEIVYATQDLWSAAGVR